MNPLKIAPKLEHQNDQSEKVSFDKNLKIVEHSSEGDFDILEKIKNKHFEARKVFGLKLRSEEAAKQSEISELISYPLIKKRLGD